MSFFVSDQLKGHIDESDLLELKEENECRLALKICNSYIDVQSIQFQKDINILTCVIKNKDDITALTTDSAGSDLYCGSAKIKSMNGQKIMQSIYKDEVSKMLFCDIIIKNEPRG